MLTFWRYLMPCYGISYRWRLASSVNVGLFFSYWLLQYPLTFHHLPVILEWICQDAMIVVVVGNALEVSWHQDQNLWGDPLFQTESFLSMVVVPLHTHRRTVQSHSACGHTSSSCDYCGQWRSPAHSPHIVHCVEEAPGMTTWGQISAVLVAGVSVWSDEMRAPCVLSELDSS